jgi:hypothetical protein
VATSYNGWPASPIPSQIDVDPTFTAGGVTFPGGVKAGPVATVFADLLTHWNRCVETLVQGWNWGYEFRPVRGNPSELSNHSSASAVDVMAPLHPQGVSGTYSPRQVLTIRRILDRYDGAIAWGGDFYGTVDEMHLEVDAGPEELDELARRLVREQSNPIIPEALDMPLSRDDITAVADEVMHRLTSDRLLAMLVVDSSSGSESRVDVSITRALQSAQTQSARAAYRAGHP